MMIEPVLQIIFEDGERLSFKADWVEKEREEYVGLIKNNPLKRK